MKKKISFFLVIIWLIVIFIMSSMSGEESNDKSQGAITKAIEKTVSTTNEMGITNKHPSESKKEDVTKKLNLPLRKCMHATEYFVLALLVANYLRFYKISLIKLFFITVLFCFLYACTDEYHQLFVKGRSAHFTDSLIDTTGAFIGSLIWVVLCVIKNKFIKVEKKCDT